MEENNHGFDLTVKEENAEIKHKVVTRFSPNQFSIELFYLFVWI